MVPEMSEERVTEHRRADDERFNRIEFKLDEVLAQMNSMAVANEHRVTKLETKAGLYGFLGGVVASVMASVLAGIILAVVMRK